MADQSNTLDKLSVLLGRLEVSQERTYQELGELSASVRELRESTAAHRAFAESTDRSRDQRSVEWERILQLHTQQLEVLTRRVDLIERETQAVEKLTATVAGLATELQKWKADKAKIAGIVIGLGLAGGSLAQFLKGVF